MVVRNGPNVFFQGGGRDFPEQWLPPLATHRYYLGSFGKYYCLGLTPRNSGLIGPWCSLDSRIFKSSPTDSNVQSKPRLTGVEAENYKHKAAQRGPSPIKAMQSSLRYSSGSLALTLLPYIVSFLFYRALNSVTPLRQ